MADWKQITARIRRARTGKDPAGQLSTLFEKTRDAMVAFELARFFETSGQNSDAAKWYIAAAERFRRADWKAKAQEAAVRLGAEVAAATASESSTDLEVATPIVEPESSPSAGTEEAAAVDASGESLAVPEPAATSSALAADPPQRDGKRRRRRGGRNRNRAGSRAASSTSRLSGAAPPASEVLRSGAGEAPTETESRRLAHPRAIPTLPVEPASESAVAGVRGRSGDPGLSSRLSALEMQLRRLLTCPPVQLSDADHAPAGPGVLVLTDSDLTSYYYVEACQTLRIAVANLLRGGASRRGTESIKPRLAEHLGIPETRVGKYLADHCVVRWLQLDEGASHFAHFVIAVIRPILNE